MPSSVEMGEGWRYTLVLNNTDSELMVEYIGAKYALVPKGYRVIRWNYVDHTDKALPLLKFSTGGMELDPVFSIDDLCENKRIIIFGDLVNSSSCQMTPRTDPKTNGHRYPGGRPDDSSWLSVDDLLRTMGELEKEVGIWHNQCKHLLKKYQEAVDRVNRVFLEFRDIHERDLEIMHMDSQDPTHVCLRHIQDSWDIALNLTLIYSMLEGEALLRSCGEIVYNQAAFALTSRQPCVPTYSKFAFAIRELDWNVNFLCCVIEGKQLGLPSLDSWEWCDERCRLVNSDFKNRLDASEDDSLEADVRRQNADREALHSSLDRKQLSKSPGTSSSKSLDSAQAVQGGGVQRELESIWRKRLQASSCAPGSYFPLDAFIIENTDTSFVQVLGSRPRNGTSKSVQKCKWLGQTVALSTMSNVSKVSAQAETGFLARVQHPNVVEWMGYSFKEDLRDPNCYRECFLVTEYMECDLHDLITERLTGDDGKISKTRSPFHFIAAVDIALQIVEAMIHVHRCRVIHRDLKPRNILASPKYSRSRCKWVPTQYTIKLIDFGSSKGGDQGSQFHTRKQGTPIYMAPEVWESEDSYSWSADVYSFGLTCFEIFTGRLPFEDGMAWTFANIQQVLRQGDIIFPRWCPPQLNALMLKCCALDPSERPCFEDIRKALWRLKVLYGSHSFFFFYFS